MTWPLAKIDLINQALLLTGNVQAALNDGSDEFNVASAAYESAIEFLFDTHNWSAMSKIAVVARTGLPTDADFPDAYDKPADLVHVISVHDTANVAIRYTVLGASIFADAAGGSMRLKYVASGLSANASRSFMAALLWFVIAGVYRGLNEDTEQADKAQASAQGIIGHAVERDQQETQAQPRTTSYPLDRLTLVNDALVMAGRPMRPQTDDGSIDWNTGAVAYQAALERMLDACDWNFATIEATVARSGAPTDPSFADAYDKPADLLHIVWVRASNAAIRYGVLANQIVANNAGASIQVKYVKQPTIDQVSPLFTASLRAFILSAVLRAVVKDAKEADAQWQMAEGYLKEAVERSYDETQAQPRTSGPLDKLAVVNDCLNLMGERPRSQIDDGSKEWRIGSSAYDTALGHVLESHDWKMSTKVDTLTQVGDAGDPAWAFAFTKPTDMLHLLWVKAGDPLAAVAYEVSGVRQLFANVGTITVRYIAQPTPDQVSPLFLSALRCFILSGLYRGLRNDPKEADTQWTLGEQYIERASERADDETLAQPRTSAWPLDKLTIINDALALSGNRIRSQAEDGSKEWNVGSAAYESALLMMLDSGDWKFASVVAPLSTAGAPADTAWSQSFTKPADFLHLEWVKAGAPLAAVAYEVLGGKILANTTPVTIKYLAQPAIGQISPMFVSALRSFVLAGVYRGLVKDGGKEAEAQWALAEKYLARAVERADAETRAQPRTTAWPLDKLTIINDALALSGNKPLGQIEDGSKEWNVCTAAYESALLRMLEAHNWPFGTHVATLTRAGTPSDPAFLDAYDKPDDLLHLIWVRLNDVPVTYQVLENQIVLNASGQAVTAKYVRQPTVDLLPPTFVDALRTYVESACFQALGTPNAGEAAHKWNRAENWRKEAMTKVDQEQPKRALFQSRLSASRLIRRPWPRTTSPTWPA